MGRASRGAVRRRSTGSPLSPLAVVLESGDPGDVPAVREGRAGVQDAGPNWSPWPCAGPRSRAATSGGWTCAPAPAARPRCWRRWRTAGRAAARQRAAAAPGDAGPPGTAGDRRRRRRRRRHPPRLAPALRPGAGRRPVHRSRRAAASSGEPLATPSRGPRRAGPAAARAAGAARWTASGPGEWSPTRPARPSSRRPRGVVDARAGRPRRRTPRGRPAAAARSRPTPPPPARGRGPAVAAPARHRCDVPGTAASR